MTREEAKDRLQKIRHEYTFNSNKEATQNLKAFNIATEALSADRPSGKWNKFDTGIYLCSNCNWAVGNEYNYCPCCGARMKRGDETDEG